MCKDFLVLTQVSALDPRIVGYTKGHAEQLKMLMRHFQHVLSGEEQVEYEIRSTTFAKNLEEYDVNMHLDDWWT